jgi:xanthine/CO dehydrogenase XdhC/CoxF family maturation factor
MNLRAHARLDTSLELLIEQAPEDRAPRVLATVVATAGSTYRKPGARMLIMADGSHLGLLSGGCLESDLMIHARTVMDGGVPQVVEYDMRGPDDLLFGVGAGCEGAMRVLLEPCGAGSPAWAALAGAALATGAGRPAVLVTVHEAATGPLGTRAPAPAGVLGAAVQRCRTEKASQVIDIDIEEDGRLRAFVQYLATPPLLLICGAGPDAHPVVSTARGLGWRVIVVDHRPAYAVADRFLGAVVHCAAASALHSTVDLTQCHAAVVMSHHLASDADYLRQLAAAGAPDYVGLLGPAARRARLAEELGAAADQLRGRLRGPVGLDIGAVTPEGIALSIVGQIHAWLAGRPVGDAQQAVRAIRETVK